MLIKRDKTFFVEELNRKFTKEGGEYFVRDASKDYSTQFGTVKSKDLAKKDGSVVKATTGDEFIILSPGFIDKYRRIKRTAQIIPMKDIGSIITLTGIDKNSLVVDSGSGSGGLCCFLAHIAKKVVTYEIKDENVELVRENAKFLELDNITVKKKSFYDGIDEKNVDLITLDLPEPWEALKVAEKALKIGGFLVSYSPTIPQVQDFVNAMKKFDSLILMKTIEILEREWEIDGRKVRPRTQGIGHSGFLTFARKI